MDYIYTSKADDKNSLSHKGAKGMKWGYNHGKKNGKRTAGEAIEDFIDDVAFEVEWQMDQIKDSVEDLYWDIRTFMWDVERFVMEDITGSAWKGYARAARYELKYYQKEKVHSKKVWESYGDKFEGSYADDILSDAISDVQQDLASYRKGYENSLFGRAEKWFNKTFGKK